MEGAEEHLTREDPSLGLESKSCTDLGFGEGITSITGSHSQAPAHAGE